MRHDRDIIEMEDTSLREAGELLAQLDPADEEALWLSIYQTIEQQMPMQSQFIRYLQADDASTLEPVDMLPERQLDVFLEVLGNGNRRSAAARAAGILPSQITSLKRELAQPLPKGAAARAAALHRRKKIQDFFQTIEEVESQVEQLYVQTVHEAATKGKDLNAAKYMLERRFREGWAPDKKVIHTGNTPGGGVTNVTNNVSVTNNVDSRKQFAALTNEQLAAIEEMYAAQREAPAPAQQSRLPGRQE